MNLSELQEFVKKNHETLGGIYISEGTDKYLQEQIQNTFKNLIPEDQKVMNLGQYDLSEMDLAVPLDDMSSAPFFGDYRLVIINNPIFLTGERSKIKYDLDALLEYINNPEPTSIVLFIANYEKMDKRKKVVKELLKKAQIIDAKQPSEAQLQLMVKKYLKEQKVDINPDALNELILRTDNNLSRIMNEIKKLQIYAADTNVIDKKAVDGLVSRSLNQNVFNLIDDLMQRNTKKAIMDYATLIFNQEQPLRINAALLSQFRLLLQVKVLAQRGMSQGNISQELKVHPYRVKLALQKIRQFSLDKLERGFLGILEMERKLKTTQRDSQELFELFLVSFLNR